MNRKELLENLEDLAKQAAERQDSLDIAACLRVFVTGARKQDTFLLKFMQVYSHLNYSDEDGDLWTKLSQKAVRSKDRNIALQIRGFLVNVLGMSPKDPDFSCIKKEVMSDPPRYDLFFALLNRDGLPIEPIKIFQIREIVERHIESRNPSGQQ
ncbi:MAG TPA: hypothetical protein DCR97_03130 [Deltaproteobacteria bacterium]|nr:hypothetical protein [Deltaproteobacteria bacterium]